MTRGNCRLSTTPGGLLPSSSGPSGPGLREKSTASSLNQIPGENLGPRAPLRSPSRLATASRSLLVEHFQDFRVLSLKDPTSYASAQRLSGDILYKLMHADVLEIRNQVRRRICLPRTPPSLSRWFKIDSLAAYTLGRIRDTMRHTPCLVARHNGRGMIGPGKVVDSIHESP